MSMTNRMPSCVGKTHRQIWQQYKEAYPELTEAQLREIHLRWVRAWTAAGL